MNGLSISTGKCRSFQRSGNEIRKKYWVIKIKINSISNMEFFKHNVPEFGQKLFECHGQNCLSRKRIYIQKQPDSLLLQCTLKIVLDNNPSHIVSRPRDKIQHT